MIKILVNIGWGNGLIAPSHYPNQCYLNNKVLWHASEGILTKRFLNNYHPHPHRPPPPPPPHPLLQWRKLIWCLNIHSIFGHCYLTYLVLRPEYSRLAGSIKWLLIFCFLQSPGHQQLIYWYSNGFIEMNASLIHKEGSKYLCTLPRVETVKQLGPWNGLSIFVRWRLWNSWDREMV